MSSRSYVEGHGHGHGSSRKRKGQNLENGDRFCSDCGVVIYKQANKKIGHCPVCNVHQPFMSNMWKFASGFGRCSEVGCGVIITDKMKYCYFCGVLSEVTLKKREREEAEKLVAEKKKNEELALENAKLKEALKERDEVIGKSEDRYFKKLTPPDTLEIFASDDDDELLASGNKAEEEEKRKVEDSSKDPETSK